MSSIQERKFYLQLWSLTTGPAVKVMKHFFEVKILNNSKFESFLNDQNNMHILFHQCCPTIPCCKCVTVSLASPKKKGCLNFKQFDMLYDISGLPQPRHENITGSKVNQYCLCKYSSKRSIKVSGLDITLFNNIIQHCCPSKMNFMRRQTVKDIRNFLAHAGHGKIGKADFESHWKALETATLGFASEMGDVCEEMFQDEISRILNSSTDQLRDKLKEMLDKSNNDLKNMLDLNGFHTLKTTAEECKTNIKLVHQKQEAHHKQLNRIESSTGQTKDILTQIQLTTEESIGEVKHRLNNFESIIKVAVVQAIEEEKGKHMNAENRKINVGTQVDSKSWDEENTLRNLSKIVTTEIDRQSADIEEFHVKSLENKCIQLELVAFPDVFKNTQNLRKAVKSLINQLVKAGEIDTYIPGKLQIQFTVKTPLTKEELAVVYSVFDKHDMLEESTATEMNVITNLFDTNSITQTLKLEPDSFGRSDDQSDFTDKDDFSLYQQVKMEKTNEEKYEEIFVNVDNLKCLLKLNGLPNDLNQPESAEVSPDTEGSQLLYLEWTFECPETWNLSLIVSSIRDNISAFPDEFPVDYVYNETTNTFIMHTTAKRFVFRSYSSLEAAVVKFIGKIINLSSIESPEPDELSATVLIMTKPEEEEHLQSEINKDVKTDQSILGLKDKIVTCEHCTKDFCCKKCMSKINHIRRLNQALKMKDLTIQRLERALTKREEDMIEEDKSDNDSDYSVEKITLHEDSEEENINTSKTAGIGILEEPEKKKRKTAIACTSDIAKSKDVSESLNTNDSYILVDVKQALQKLAEIPLVDYLLKMYRTYIKDFNQKWIRYRKSPLINPTNTKEILNNLSKERKKRTNLIAKLVDVIHNRYEFTTTDEAYNTDIQFLNVGYPTTKCTYCHTKEANQIACYCKDCNIFICNNCVIEHRMKNTNHNCLYQSKMLREYRQANSFGLLLHSGLIDLKFVAADMIAILYIDKLCTYNLTGELTNSVSIGTVQNLIGRIACINNCQMAVTEPGHNLIKIVTIIAPITITDVKTPAGTNMTGGITCKMDVLYVAFTDAIQLMDLSGQIQRVVNIPDVTLLHSVNNDKMLCVYNMFDSVKTVSCLDFTNDSLYDFERFPFNPEDVTSDDIGNIIFIEKSVIWQADSYGKNIKLIMSPERDTWYENITYNRDSKHLLIYNHGHRNVKVYKKLE